MVRAAAGSVPLWSATIVYQSSPAASARSTGGRSARAAAASIGASGAVCTRVSGRLVQPRSSRVVFTGAASGSGALIRGCWPRSPYHLTTASMAASSGRSGSPTASAELARPVQLSAARSSQPPSRPRTGAGHASSAASSSAITAAACGRRAAGTRLARCTSRSGTRTVPLSVASVRSVSVRSTSSPSASVKSVRSPDTPTIRRTTTRCPTSCCRSTHYLPRREY